MCTNDRTCLSTPAAKVPYDRAMDSLIEPTSLAGLEPDTIAISNVNLSLGAGAARVHILKDISLRVAPGEAIGLIGPSGSGKSTLLMVMAGLERPDSGEVVVNGTPFNALDEDALARFRGRQVGIVFQSFHLIPTMTALENVAVPLTTTSPLSGRSNPAITISSVDFPEPDGPIKPIASPGATRRLISLRICTRAAPAPSERLTFEMAMVSGSRPANDEGSMRLSMARSYGTSATAVEGQGWMFVHILVLVLALVMAGTASAQAPAPKAAKPIKMVVLGDSLSAGLGLQASAAFPAKLQKS